MNEISLRLIIVSLCITVGFSSNGQTTTQSTTVEELQQKVELLNQQLATTLMKATGADNNVTMQQACKFVAITLSAQLPRLSRQLALWAASEPEQKRAQRNSLVTTALYLVQLEQLLPLILQNLLLQEATIKAEMNVIKAKYPTTWLQWTLFHKGYEYGSHEDVEKLRTLTKELQAIRSLSLKLRLFITAQRLTNWTAESSSIPARILYRILR